MTLVELRYFVAVAEEKSFRKAAERVHVSQPALSLAIQRLEDEFALALFERGKTSIALTVAGVQVLAQARRVLAEATALRDVAAQAKDPFAGAFRIGMIHTVGPYLLPLLASRCRVQLPAIELSVEEGLTDDLRVRLDRSELDAIVIALPFDAPGVDVLALYDEPFDVVMPRGSALARRKTITPDDLRDQTMLLLHSGHCFSNQVAGACPGVSGHARVLDGNSLETVRHMVASGHGVSVLPRSAAWSPTTAALLAVRPFAEPAPRRRVAIAWRRSFVRPQVVHAVADMIRACGLAGVELLDAAPVASVAIAPSA